MVPPPEDLGSPLDLVQCVHALFNLPKLYLLLSPLVEIKCSAINPVLVMLLEQDQFNLKRILICVFILDVAHSHKKYQRI